MAHHSLHPIALCSLHDLDSLFQGVKQNNFVYARGVRQGCPANMLLFVLALDPIVRWLRVRALRPGDRLGAYADDLGFALQDAHESLERLGRAFAHVGSTTGLVLRMEKCALVPYNAIHSRTL